MPPRAALDNLPCAPALDTTKNEHLHTSMTLARPRDFTVDVSVFRAHLPQSPYRCYLLAWETFTSAGQSGGQGVNPLTPSHRGG